ncbi:hypothetical protein VHEMI07908 [[Torrubiella] hemipterigena]|uniref:Uncharacterized protein n=1 Tax=[Torrubiella] hemipterigena TaxID=1531966 RepID=A0A0A1TNT2_9HYPO|nr:hypothetical protein VHEMI07908 [[Torrubiella] hemipterigena]
MQASLFLSFAITAIIGVGYTAPVPAATTTTISSSSSSVATSAATSVAAKPVIIIGHDDVDKNNDNNNKDKDEDEEDEEDEDEEEGEDSTSAGALSTPSKINPDEAAGHQFADTYFDRPSATWCFMRNDRLYCPAGNGDGCEWRLVTPGNSYTVLRCPYSGCRDAWDGAGSNVGCY